MAVVIETTLGDITVDLYLEQRPVTCLNFLKLCKMKYYNFNLFYSIRSGFIAQTGDPSGEGTGGQSIWGILEGPKKQYFSGEKMPKIRHTGAGLLSMVCTGDMMVGSQFFFTLASDLNSLDGVHCVIGEVTEGHDVLRKLNDVICDEAHRPFQDVRITHTIVLEDPFNDPAGFRAPSRSPSPSAERLKGGRIAPDEDLDETQGKSAAEIQELIEEKEAKARATILEIVGDLPDADIAPPENVLFVCKLNPVTTDEDLEIIFSRFGKIVSCEVIRDKKTGDSLQYAFIEFADKKYCENAYLKMDNVLIDDRRIHVDFSQSVSKVKWLGKGRGVKHLNDDDLKEEISSKSRNKKTESIDDNKRSNYLRHLQNKEREKYNNRDKYYERQRKSSKSDRERDTKRSERYIHKEKNSSRNEKESKQNRREKSNEREKISVQYSTNDHREKEARKDKYSRTAKNIAPGKGTDKSSDVSLDRHTSSRHNIDKYPKENRDSSNGRDGGYEKQTKGRSNEKNQNTNVEDRGSLDKNPRSRNDKERYVENKNHSRLSEKQERNFDKPSQKRSKDSSHDSDNQKDTNKINLNRQEERQAKNRYNDFNAHNEDFKRNYEDKRRSTSRSKSDMELNKKAKESKSSRSYENSELRKSSIKEKEKQPSNKGNGEVDGYKKNKRSNEKPITHKSKKAKLCDSSGEKEKSKGKKETAKKVSKVDKKRKRKRKQSTSSDSDSTSSSSSSESSSSEEDRKKRRTRKKRKRSSSSSSSESSSSSSSSSSSDSRSDSSSSSSDSDSRTKKRKTSKKVVKKSKKK